MGIAAHSDFIVLALGAMGMAAILASLASRRVGAPLLLVFLAIGMIAGAAGQRHVVAAGDFRHAYTLGTLALVVILFEGGLKTSLAMVRLALWPALVLATVGVAATTGLTALLLRAIAPVTWMGALLAGAITAPTDAAAVGAVLRRAHVALPERVMAVLELESGLNDPASVFLTLLLIHLMIGAGPATPLAMAGDFLLQMGGGIALGLAGGAGLVRLLRLLPLELPLTPVFALASVFGLFGLAQTLHASGFMAVYIAAIMTGTARFRARAQVGHFFEGMAWLAQIVLFLMLGLLVTPSGLATALWPAVPATLALIVVSRPLAVAACLLPFGFRVREIAFAGWVGLRGAVPIYLCLIPVAADPRGTRLFDAIFVVVIASLVIQGWTIGLAARLLGFGAAHPGPARGGLGVGGDAGYGSTSGM